MRASKPPVSHTGKGEKPVEAAPPTKHPGGRPTKYKKKYAKAAYDLCAGYGVDNKGLAKAFSVSIDAIKDWLKKHEEFSTSVKSGRDYWNNNRVEKSLLQRALGYQYTEITREPLYNPTTGEPLKDKKTKKPIIEVTKKVTKSVAPDTAAIIFYLKNRDRERWRDRIDHTHSNPDGSPLELTVTFVSAGAPDAKS